MPWFKKKPVVIEAFQLTDTTVDEIAAWCGGRIVAVTFGGGLEGIEIPTLEGTMIATPGDYVIRGVKGEFYPCKPDIFAASYDDASFDG